MVELRYSGIVSPSAGCTGFCAPRNNLFSLIHPSLIAVSLFFFIPTGEETVCNIKFIGRINQEGSVRVVHHVLFLIELLLKNVVNHAAEESDIGTWTNRGIHIGLRGGTSKARVNNDPLGAAVNGAVAPAGRQRMVFNVVGTDGHDDIGVLEIAPVAGHGAASKGRG